MYLFYVFTIRNFSKWILSNQIKLKRKIRKPYLTLLKSIEWLENDWLVYGRICGGGVEGARIGRQNGQIHEFDTITL